MLESATTAIGIILATISGLLIIFMYAPLPWGAPFQPSSRKETKNLIQLTAPKKTDRIAELGSGAGRLVIELAKHGAKVDGYEINPFLVWISRKRIKKIGLEKKAKIYKASFWETNLSKYNKIVLFQVYYVMPRLLKKLKRYDKKFKIISNTWKFPKIRFNKKAGHCYLYKL